MKNKIITQYRYKQFVKIPKSKLHEFVGPIVTRNDHEILETWKAHFKSVKVPFIVIERKLGYLDKAKFLVTERII